MPTTQPKILCLFVDIGGVLLTNGWDHDSRALAARVFGLDKNEMESRHRLIFDLYEEGKCPLKDYLNHVVFYRRRAFTPGEFRQFMYLQSKPYPHMIDLVRGLKARYRLKIVVVSNEARELNAYRIRKFGLNTFVDAFISSCFVHLRKPDPDMFRLALDIGQVGADNVVYLENTPMFAGVAASLGIRSIMHTDYALTRRALAAWGLKHT